MPKLFAMKGDSYTSERMQKWLREDEQVIAQIKRDEFRCLVRVEHGGYFPDDTQRPYFVTYRSAQGNRCITCTVGTVTG